MDNEPMWAANHVVAPTSGSAITIPKTVNEFAIKALFDQLLEEIRAFSEHENESLTDAWLCMKEMLQNCHGHNMYKGNIIKIFYHGLSEITQEVLNAAASGIFLYKTPNQAYQLLKDKVLLNLDCATNQKTKPSLKKTITFADEDAQYKELQSNDKKAKPDLDEDDIPMSREEESKFMQTFRIAENMLVEVCKFTFPVDFVILEMEEDSKVSLILGRPFLHTADAVIRVKQKQVNFGIRTERMIFNIDSSMKHSYSNDDTCNAPLRKEDVMS
nr:reverse transcriptase domain-containing protein [Tanacetum cinerariifolium]GEX54690.1 reverse transcriptase domain-containing protein [Tanacetum cinerariifolium]